MAERLDLCQTSTACHRNPHRAAATPRSQKPADPMPKNPYESFGNLSDHEKRLWIDDTEPSIEGKRTPPGFDRVVSASVAIEIASHMIDDLVRFAADAAQRHYKPGAKLRLSDMSAHPSMHCLGGFWTAPPVGPDGAIELALQLPDKLLNGLFGLLHDSTGPDWSRRDWIRDDEIDYVAAHTSDLIMMGALSMPDTQPAPPGPVFTVVPNVEAESKPWWRLKPEAKPTNVIRFPGVPSTVSVPRISGQGALAAWSIGESLRDAIESMTNNDPTADPVADAVGAEMLGITRRDYKRRRKATRNCLKRATADAQYAREWLRRETDPEKALMGFFGFKTRDSVRRFRRKFNSRA